MNFSEKKVFHSFYVENVENFCLFSKFRAFLNSKKARYPLCFPTFPQKRGGKLCIFMHAFSDFSTRKSQKGKLYNLYNHAFFCQKMPPKKAFFRPLRWQFLPFFRCFAMPFSALRRSCMFCARAACILCLFRRPSV